MQLVAQTQYIHATREHRVQVEVKGDPVDYGTGEHAEFLKLGTLEAEEPVVFDRGFTVRSQGNSDLLVAEILSPAPVNEDDLPDALEVDEGAENEVSEALEARRVEQVAEPPLEHTEAAEKADEQREEGRPDEGDQTQAPGPGVTQTDQEQQKTQETQATEAPTETQTPAAKASKKK